MSVFRVSKKSGFTIIEVIVACAVLAILSMIVYGTVSGMREKARDTQRMSDIEQLRLAMKLYQDTYGAYPDYRFGTDIGSGEAIDTELEAFFGEVPSDPLGTDFGLFKYGYDSEFDCPVAGGDVVLLFAESMERESNGNWSSVCNGVEPGTNTYAVILYR